MDEQTQSQTQSEATQKTTEGAAENSSKGDITSTTSIIDKADSVAQRMEKANERAEILNQKIESNLARMMLGGKTEAGAITKTKDELLKEEVEKQAKEIAERFKIPRL